MAKVQPTVKSNIHPAVLFFLIGVAMLVLAMSSGKYLGTGVTAFFYVVGFIIVAVIILGLIRDVLG